LPPLGAGSQRRREGFINTSGRFLRVAGACLAAAAALAARAQLPAEPLSAEQLAPRASPHWVWVNDINFFSMPDGQAFLVDGDNGRMLGMLSTGYSFNSLILPKSGDVIYSPESYYSRGTRGARTDVITLYDTQHLQPLGEIVIPPKRSSNMPMNAAAALTDDERFLVVYNFTPAQSVSIVDVRARKFLGEIDTAGCALVYPTGPRTFFSVCGDGAVLHVTLGEDGKLAKRIHSPALFDAMKDPLTEKAVRVGDTWYFASFQGTVYPIHATPRGVELAAKWGLVSAAEQAQGWRSGGLQHLAAHRPSGRLFAIMHRGGLETHKDPGTDIWVYDLTTRKRVQQISTKHKAGSIAVSQDDKPLLFTCFIESNVLDIYDALSGHYLRSVESLGQTPTVMVTP
jgi:methylamine dehydrogenase heavy chain